MKDDWISFPIPGAPAEWTRAESIIGVEPITALTLAQSKLSKEMDRTHFIGEHPEADIPEAADSPAFKELKQAKAVILYTPRWGAFQDAYRIYTTLDPAEAIAHIRAVEAKL